MAISFTVCVLGGVLSVIVQSFIFNMTPTFQAKSTRITSLPTRWLERDDVAGWFVLDPNLREDRVAIRAEFAVREAKARLR